MVNFQNSKEFNEVIKNLNDKDFSKALKKIDSISKKYQNENIIFLGLAAARLRCRPRSNELGRQKRRVSHRRLPWSVR